MRIGKLRHRITIQSVTETQGTDGAIVKTWADFATVSASKTHKTSREFFAAQKVNAEMTDLFITRHLAGVTPKMRVSFDGKYYDIIGAPDPDGRKRELHITCKEVV